jgi:hypothetical protein
MRATDFRHKLHIHGKKIALVTALVACAVVTNAQRQTRWVQRNNPNYDDRKLTYGFLIGLHSSIYNINYDDAFVTQQLDTLFAVNPEWSSGFSLGFIVNYRLSEFFDLRLTPEVAFYEQRVRYQYTNETFEDAIIESTMVELPFLLKYKSERRGNIRMYMIGGVKPGIEASGKKDQIKEELEISKFNVSLEAGFGFDLYYPLFKFSPELRFSRGMVDILDNRTNDFGVPLRRVNTNTITLYLLFQ